MTFFNYNQSQMFKANCLTQIWSNNKKNKEQGFHVKTQNQRQNILQNILPQIVMIIKLKIERRNKTKKKHKIIFFLPEHFVFVDGYSYQQRI